MSSAITAHDGSRWSGRFRTETDPVDRDLYSPEGRSPERSEGEWVRLERWDRPTVVLTGFSATNLDVRFAPTTDEDRTW